MSNQEPRGRQSRRPQAPLEGNHVEHPGYLLKLGTERVFIHTDLLAERNDMAPCDKQGKRLDVPVGESHNRAQAERIAELEKQLELVVGGNGAVVMEALREESEALKETLGEARMEVESLQASLAAKVSEPPPFLETVEPPPFLETVEARIDACDKDKGKLEELARDLFNVELDKRATWDRLVEKVREVAKADGRVG